MSRRLRLLPLALAVMLAPAWLGGSRVGLVVVAFVAVCLALRPRRRCR